MEINDIIKVAATFVVSAGGISAVICGISNFLANKIADRLQSKYQLELDKQLEKEKTVLGNKTYITQTKFNVEFELYRELSKAFSCLVRDISVMIPSGFSNVPADKEKRKEYDKDIYQKAYTSYYDAQNTLFGNMPFISKEFTDKYSMILRLSYSQLTAFERRWSHSFLGNYEEKSNLENKVYERTNEINTKFEELNCAIRDYLDNLDVLE